MDSLLDESDLMSIKDEITSPQFSAHMSSAASALLRSESVLSWVSLDESCLSDTNNNGEGVCEDSPKREIFFSHYDENATIPVWKETSSMERPAVESKSISLGMDYRPAPWDVVSESVLYLMLAFPLLKSSEGIRGFALIETCPLSCFVFRFLEKVTVALITLAIGDFAFSWRAIFQNT
jgi:hypothetical protein